MRGVGTWRGGVAAVPAPFEPAFAACRPKNRSIVAFPPRFGLFGRRPHPLARRSAESRASRPLRPKMEALHLHPAPQAAADEAAMHGAGPMQARFSPYDYNGGSVHAPGRAKALPLTGKKSCRCSLWPFPVTHALAVCLTLRVPFAGPCLPSRARILPSSPATRAAARASPSCPATSARSTRCELAGCARAPARARESKERRLRFSP